MAQTSYQDIKSYHSNLVAELGNEIPFSKDNFPLLIRMGTTNDEGLGKLINDTGCENVLAAFGLDEGGNFTVSFLALDSNMEVDARHISNGINGEERWPSSSVTYFGNAPGGSANDTLP